MGYKCSFMDNEVYLAKDVNELFSRLTTEGVALAESGNIISDLNEATAQTVTEGVSDVEDCCRVIVDNGVYKISKGVCFMPDGSAITFDKNGYELVIAPETYQYVYLSPNPPKNTIDIIVSETAGGENTVPLAEIDEEGIVIDRRKYARAKVRYNSEGGLKKFTATFEEGKEVQTTIDVGTGNFSNIIFRGLNFYINGEFHNDLVVTNYNCRDIVDGETMRVVYSESREGYTAREFNFTKNGQYIDIVETYGGTNSVDVLEFEVI